jgi:AcrR family transcriptional regulator
MARSVNEEDFANRRNEILDTAYQLIYTRGYEQMTIQDILMQLNISKGAFYHYFRSKLELMEALVDRMGLQMEQLLKPVIEDDNLSAVAKLQLFFDTGARWKTARKDLMITLLRVWYHDDNVLVREKVRLITFRRVLPLLTCIVQQGVREGVMNTPYPDQIAEVFLALSNGMTDTLVDLTLLAADGKPGDLQQARKYTAMYTDAIERVLGITPGTLLMMDDQTLKAWFG